MLVSETFVYFAFFAANPPNPIIFLLRTLRAFVVNNALDQCTFFNFCKLRSSRGGCKRWPMIVQETSPT
jgi:hypothetical protein